MADLLGIPLQLAGIFWTNVQQAPLPLLLLMTVTFLLGTLACIYLALFVIAPTPRPPFPSERTYITTTPDGKTSSPKLLPSWHDKWLVHRAQAEKKGDFSDRDTGDIEEAEVVISVVIPAYNEEERLEKMLEEAVEYLDAEYGRPLSSNALAEKKNSQSTGVANSATKAHQRGNKAAQTSSGPSGYEIILVNDGSSDKTVDVALRFSHKKELHDIMRVVTLKDNRGKGGAVIHGFRHVRGQYAVFADADGASRFSDLGRLVEACKEVHDEPGRGVAVGSRAHLVGSEAVVKRSLLRNTLMHCFHVFLRILTPPATARIKDTQCGFKLFSRPALPHIIPYMHAEGWIFDVEMLMLAESAPAADGGKGEPGIRVKEVPIGWKEVDGSKLNVVLASIGMAWGLAILRASWMMGVYRRR